MEDLLKRIEELAQPIIDQAGLELVDFNIHRSKKNITIQMLADRYNGGITLDECSYLNKKIGDALEQENIISDYYVVEVSSPGLDRPLKTLRDFSKVIGRQIHVFLSEPIEGKIEHIGIVKEIKGEDVIMEHNSATIIIPASKINKGKQVI